MDGDGRSFIETFLSKLFQKPKRDITEHEIRTMVDQGNQSGGIEESEKEMINNVFEFDDLLVDDVMTHRIDIVAVDEEAKISDIIYLAINKGFSRIPVYREDIDDIIGVIYVKDLLCLVVHSDTDKNSIKDFMREIMYIPESIKCKDLFKKFVMKKEHIAVVVDEYGGTSGIVTMEDLIETIVGEIQDEYDNEEPEIQKIDDTTYIVNGAMDLEDFEKQLHIKIRQEDNDEYDSVGGFITSLLGMIPSEKEHPVVQIEGANLTVDVVEDRRILKVKVELLKDIKEKQEIKE